MTATAATESQIRALIDVVDRADREGNRGEAERALAQARAAAPDDPRVLNVAGMRALLGGDAGAARPLLERAAALDPGSPMLWLNLALAHRELKDEGAERDALERALTADPRFFPALLHKARLFERQGKPTQAAYMYHAFLCCVPPGVEHPPAVKSVMRGTSPDRPAPEPWSNTLPGLRSRWRMPRSCACCTAPASAASSRAA